MMNESRLHARIGTFRQLEILMTLARTGSIQRTADQLHLTQPSVSMQLKKLGEQIGLPMYTLAGRRVVLSDAGQAVIATARELFDSVERLESQLDDLRGLRTGVLRIAVVTTAKYCMPHLLGPFCARYPGIEVEFKIGNRQQILERVSERLDDLYVFSHPPEDEDLVCERYIPNPLHVIAYPAHPLATAPRLPLSQLAKEAMILREPGSGTRLAFETFCRAHHLTIRPKLVIESNEAIKHAVMAGLGISVVSGHTLLHGEQQGLVTLAVADFPIRHHWYLVHHRQRRFSLVAQQFLDYLRAEGRQQIQGIIDAAEHPFLPKPAQVAKK